MNIKRLTSHSTFVCFVRGVSARGDVTLNVCVRVVVCVYGDASKDSDLGSGKRAEKI